MAKGRDIIDKRLVMLVMNILLTSLAAAIVGGALTFEETAQLDLVSSTNTVRIYAAATASFVLVFTMLGYCGALSRIPLFLLLYVIFLVVLLLASVAATVAAFSIGNNVENQPWTETLLDSWRHLVEGGTTKNELLCGLQKTLKCSGFSAPPDGPKDNLGCCAAVSTPPCYPGLWPDWQSSTCPQCSNSADSAYGETCLPKVRDWLKKNLKVVALSCLGFDAFMGILLLNTIWFWCSTRKYRALL